MVNENVCVTSGRAAKGGQGSGIFNAVSAMSVGDVWDVTGGMKLDWKTEVRPLPPHRHHDWPDPEFGNYDYSGVVLCWPIQSFFFAETLKYLYLMFADPELLSLDEWVVSRLTV